MFARRTLVLAVFAGAVLAGCGANAVPGSNTASGVNPSSVLHSLAGARMNAGTPTIKHVSKIQAEQTQRIVIKGKGFGKMSPYNGDSCCIQFVVNNPACYNYGNYGTWQAGYEISGNEVGLNVTKWSNREIVITGFTGPYGEYCWSLVSGQGIRINVWNAQSDAGPATWTGTIQ